MGVGRGPSGRGAATSHDDKQPNCGVICDDRLRVGSLRVFKLERGKKKTPFFLERCSTTV